MPPITITHLEPDGQGGWYVEWHDEANLDGEPLTAYFHVAPTEVDQLCRVRQQLRAPENKLTDAAATVGRDYATVGRLLDDRFTQRRELAIPDEVEVPYADRDWVDGYADHITDCIDRVKLNVAGHAPHDALVAARAGEALAERWQRVPDRVRGVQEFAQRRRGKS